MPIDVQGPKTIHFNCLIDSIQKKNLDWITLCLSKSTQIILKNMVLVAMFSHILASFIIPSKVANRIDFILTSFWCAHKEKKKHPLVEQGYHPSS